LFGFVFVWFGSGLVCFGSAFGSGWLGFGFALVGFGFAPQNQVPTGVRPALSGIEAFFEAFFGTYPLKKLTS